MDRIPGLVYLLCAATSLVSAFLLWRNSGKGVGLLFWSSLCFLLMAVNNVLLYVDFVAFAHIDLSVAPMLASLAGIALLNWALIWHAT